MIIDFAEVEGDLAGFDFFPEDGSEGKEMRLCEGLKNAFISGDLHISIDQSCFLKIEYDGNKGSFSIKNKEECEKYRKVFKLFWAGKLRCYIGRISRYDKETKKLIFGCSIRFMPVKINNTGLGKAMFQEKLIEGYLPPELLKKKKEKVRVYIQKTLTAERFFSKTGPLFRVSKSLVKKTIEVKLPI